MKIQDIFDVDYQILDKGMASGLAFIQNIKQRDLIAEAQSLEELGQILPFDVIRRVLLFCYDAARKETHAKKEDIEAPWIKIPDFHQQIQKKSDLFFVVLEKHPVQTWFVCVKNIVSLKNVSEEQREIYVNTVARNGFPDYIPSEFRVASAISQCVPLEDADEVYFAESEIDADLWVKFQSV